eukprot:298273_1
MAAYAQDNRAAQFNCPIVISIGLLLVITILAPSHASSDAQSKPINVLAALVALISTVNAIPWHARYPFALQCKSMHRICDGHNRICTGIFAHTF